MRVMCMCMRAWGIKYGFTLHPYTFGGIPPFYPTPTLHPPYTTLHLSRLS